MDDILNQFYDVSNCPVRNIVARFGAKWPMLIIILLNTIGTARFSDIARYIPDISSKVLSKELKTLEADGLISRQAYAEIPPRVEYALTERGKTLIPLLLPLIQWAKDNMMPIQASRKHFNKK